MAGLPWTEQSTLGRHSVTATNVRSCFRASIIAWFSSLSSRSNSGGPSFAGFVKKYRATPAVFAALEAPVFLPPRRPPVVDSSFGRFSEWACEVFTSAGETFASAVDEFPSGRGLTVISSFSKIVSGVAVVDAIFPPFLWNLTGGASVLERRAAFA
jgi:hypothetical protein